MRGLLLVAMVSGYEDLCSRKGAVYKFSKMLFSEGVVSKMKTRLFGDCSASGTVSPKAKRAVVYTELGCEPGSDVMAMTTGSLELAERTTNHRDGSSTANDGKNLPMGSTDYVTEDAARLEIIFVASLTGHVQFKYFFASEEYSTSTTLFSDIFALFIGEIPKPPDSFQDPMFKSVRDLENVAIVPGTNLPVTINNVNSQVNSQFYNENENGEEKIAYDGFTDAFMTKPFLLQRGKIYRLCLKIADVGDDEVDSAIYVKPGSFDVTTDAPTFATSPPTPLPTKKYKW